jgi:hypothetical protein
LRWVTYQENSRNTTINSNNSSGYKGVCFDKKLNKWRSHIQIDGIQIHLGYYDTIEEAGKARVQRAEQAFRIYKNKCEGINHGDKPIKKRMVKQIIKPIVKLDIKQIFDEIVKLKASYIDPKLKLQKQLEFIKSM